MFAEHNILNYFVLKMEILYPYPKSQWNKILDCFERINSIFQAVEMYDSIKFIDFGILWEINV